MSNVKSMIDTHAHLNFEAFQDDLDQVLNRAYASNVETMVVVGSQLETSTKATRLAQQESCLFAAVGLHPHHADPLPDDWFSKLSKLANQNRVVAIGEIGLDYHSYIKNGVSDKNLQKKIFRKQMDLARKLKLPVIIHCRDAWEDLLPLVAQYGLGRGVFHCWSGDLHAAQTVLNLGYYISFAGNLTYPSAQLSTIQEVAQSIPLNRILLETDCPYLTPQEKRGLRNEPAFVTITGEYLANLRKVKFEEIAQATTQNAKILFGL